MERRRTGGAVSAPDVDEVEDETAEPVLSPAEARYQKHPLAWYDDELL
jgi:hypothetical protein